MLRNMYQTYTHGQTPLSAVSVYRLGTEPATWPRLPLLRTAEVSGVSTPTVAQTWQWLQSYGVSDSSEHLLAFLWAALAEYIASAAFDWRQALRVLDAGTVLAQATSSSPALEYPVVLAYRREPVQHLTGVIHTIREGNHDLALSQEEWETLGLEDPSDGG
jgi:hypothetical protein